jgi:putative transposase
MPRFERVVIPGCSHHITQRGNNRQAAFFVDDDYHVYLGLLAEQAQKHGLLIDGYCLMPNHIHLVATPAKAESLAQAVGRTHFLYTQYVNRFHGRSGHLWQNRFYSCPLDEKHFYQAMAYVERNPVKARLCRVAWRYPWSSAAWHCGMAGEAKAGVDITIADKANAGKGIPTADKKAKAGTGTSAALRSQSPFLQASSHFSISPEEWRERLQQADDERDKLIRLRTQTGRPLGTDSFLSKLEKKLGRRVRPLPVGRPKEK